MIAPPMRVFAVAVRIKDTIEVRYIVAGDEQAAVLSTAARLVTKHGYDTPDITILAAKMLPDVVTNAEGTDGKSYSIRVAIFDNTR